MVAALTLAVVGCGGGEEGYSEDVKERFTAECVPAALESGAGALSDAQARQYCNCTYDYLEANIPYEEFAEFDEKSREDPETPLPPKFDAVAERCAESLG